MNEATRLYFKVPTFHTGFNITVRKKDEKYADLSTFDSLHLFDANTKEPIGLGSYAVFVANFPAIVGIPDFLVAMNHDANARTLSGLRKAMAAAYPDTKFDVDDDDVDVMVICFYVCDPEELVQEIEVDIK